MGISVIIPAYRAVHTIERALRSVAKQTLRPDEVIVVDDGSADGTFDAASSFKDKMNGVPLKIIQQENLGAGAARNRAINEAACDWLAFLDADDEWLPEKLDISMAEIEKNDLLLFAHNYLSINDTDKLLIDCAGRFNAASDHYIGLYRKGFLATSTVVVSRNAVLEVGGFDESLATAQDFDLWLKVLKKEGRRFIVKDDALTHYYITPGSITSHTRRRLDCSMRIARRHAPSKNDFRYRVIAIHYEAVCSSFVRGHIIASIGYCFLLMWHGIFSTHKE